MHTLAEGLGNVASGGDGLGSNVFPGISELGFLI